MHLKKYQILLFATLISLLFISTSFAQNRSIYSIQCPLSKGKIVQRIDSRTEKNVIIIQDSHIHHDVQKNIADLVEYYIGQIPELTVGIEGAEGYVNVDAFRSYPDKNIRNAVADEYLKNGLFTGTEYAAITAEAEIDLIGVEEWDLFESNYITRYKIVKSDNDYRNILKDVASAAENLKVPIYKNELFRFDKIATRFEKGEISIEAYLPELYVHMRALGIDMIEYPQINTLAELVHTEPFVNFEEALHEERSLLQHLETYAGSIDFSDDTAVTRSVYIVNKCKEYHLPIKQDSEFLKMHMFNMKKSRIDASQLLQELYAVSRSIRYAYAYTVEQKKLVEVEEVLRMIINLSELKATRAEVDYYLLHSEQFDLNSICYFLKSKSQKYNLVMRVHPRSREIEENLARVKEFYEGALQRDDAISDKVCKTLRNTGKATSLLVVGGFHTEGIVEKLCARGVNVIVVSPQGDFLGHDTDIMNSLFGPLKNVQPNLVSTIQPLRTHVRSYRQTLSKSFASDAFSKTLKLLDL